MHKTGERRDPSPQQQQNTAARTQDKSSGELKPGKGIALTPSQWNVLRDNLPQLAAAQR